MSKRTSRLIRLAQNVNWYESAESVAANTRQLLNEIMALGSNQGIEEAFDLFTDAEFIDAYHHAPTGLYSYRHWAYWGLMLLGDQKALPFPVRFAEIEWECGPHPFRTTTRTD
ncbi:MAG: hypothetical protein OXE78_01005 [Gammaproteobacteria bacterium]|nr:hypothetical protein [Gammaproteobacteria bacterium]MCY4357620.1 hypothetical protein [Gammaproteobacteria bacterium]